MIHNLWRSSGKFFIKRLKKVEVVFNQSGVFFFTYSCNKEIKTFYGLLTLWTLATDGNVERAIDWIFSHLDELNSDDTPSSNSPESSTAPPGSNSSQYRLVAFISHMGTSTACGHYVCHVRESPDSDWILFNDNKVAISKKPPKGLGYLYFYEQIW